MKTSKAGEGVGGVVESSGHSKMVEKIGQRNSPILIADGS